MVQTNFVNAGKAVTEDGVVINYDQPRVLPTKNRLKLAAVVAAGTLLLVGVGGIFVASEFLDQGGSSGDGGNAITPGDDDNGQDDDNDGHNNNNNNNNHAPDSFVNYMKNLGVEGEGWDDEAYDAAYALEKNFSSMDTANPNDQEEFNDLIEKIVNPNDPYGTATLIQELLFPPVGSSVAYEKAVFEKITTMAQNWYNSDYFNDNIGTTHIDLGRGLCQVSAHCSIPELEDALLFLTNPENADKPYADINGRLVPRDTVMAYAKAVQTSLSIPFVVAVEQWGYNDASSMPVYDDYIFAQSPSPNNPDLGDDGFIKL